MRILMLGNSFTYYNQMPDILAEMLDAQTIAHTMGGAYLCAHLDPETELGFQTQRALREEKWDYVVLQEYSTGPIEKPEQFYDTVRALCGQIRENGATPVLYATWAFKRDGKKLAESGLAYEEMADALYAAYHRAGAENDVPVADVGQRFREEADELELYAEDDYHPSPEGSRIAAEVIAAAISQHSALHPRPTPKWVHVGEADSRIRVLFLYQLLLRHTDENHPLSSVEIRRRMQAHFGEEIHRTTLPRDIAVLRSAGIEVMQTRTRTVNYYLSDRTFSIPELRLLIDAVLSSKFITESKSRELTEKLISMTSDTSADKLRRSIHVTGKAKSDNEKGYYIVDAIHEAMNLGRKIAFGYYDYDSKKRRRLMNDGAPYTVSPYDLIWDGDYYYLTGYCDERGEVRTFRVDRIDSCPEILKEPIHRQPKSYRAERYTQEVFRMYATDKTVAVQLLCENEVMKFIIDQFGQKVRTRVMDEAHFRATVKVCPSPTFFRWIFGFGGKIVIEGPEDVRGQYKSMLAEEMARY